MGKTTAEVIRERKIIAIVRGLKPDLLLKLAEALYKGGIGLIEVTFAQNAPDTWGETASGIKSIREEFGGEVLSGAGTVMSLEQLKMADGAGAKYIISPNADSAVIKRTKELGLVSIPGAFTATEIAAAYSDGADFVKVFPADGVGPAYIKALRAPLSHIPLMAVGGVNERTIADFLKAGCVGVGVGGCLVRKDLIAEGKFSEITDLARLYVAAANNA